MFFQKNLAHANTHRERERRWDNQKDHMLCTRIIEQKFKAEAKDVTTGFLAWYGSIYVQIVVTCVMLMVYL